MKKLFFITVNLLSIICSAQYQVIDNHIGTEGTSFNTTSFKVVGDKLFFVSYEDVEQYEWRTLHKNSTKIQLVKELNSSTFNCQTCTQRVANFRDSLLLFKASVINFSEEIFVSDGTSNGTFMLKDIRKGALGSDISTITVLDSIAYFFATESSVWGDRDIWQTDGTSQGTIKFYDASDDPVTGSFIFMKLLDKNTMIIFGIRDVYSMNLKTKKTELLTTFKDLLVSGYFTANKEGKMYFYGTSDDKNDELWVTDGTATNTKRVLVSNGSIDAYYKIKDKIVVKMHIGNSNYGDRTAEFYALDELKDTAYLIKDIDPLNTQGFTGPETVTVTDNYAFFYQGNKALGIEPYVTDGTAEGTFLLKDINTAGSSGNGIAISTGKNVFFTATSLEHGNELWVTDGTVEGTRLFLDLNEGVGSSNIQALTLWGDDYLVFTADLPLFGRELVKVNIKPYLTSTDKLTLKEVDFEMFPIPAKEILTLTTEQNSTVTILDLNGRIILQKEIEAGTTKLSTSDLEQGMYIIKLETKGKTTSRKLYIE